MKKRFIRISLYILFICTIIAFNSMGEDDDLGIKLKKIRVLLSEASKEIAKENRKFYKAQHDLVYTNDEISKVYQNVKNLEKQLIYERKKLNDAINNTPEMKKFVKSRNAVYKKYRKIKQEEQMLLGRIQLKKP